MIRNGFVALSMSLWLGIPSVLLGQSSPVDLTELSLAELMQIDVGTSQEGQSLIRIGYRYRRVEFEGYRDGTHRMPVSDVIGPLGPNSFPIVQTAITQQAHLLNLGYDINKSWSIDMVVPYIKQSTDHNSVIPDFGFFVIETDGIGDIVITGSRRFRLNERSALQLSAGLSFPTGSIDETGDTPSPGLVNPLPYTMQLGSGTWNLPLGVAYTSRSKTGRFDFGGQAYGMIRMGKNNADYRLGHRLAVTGWLEAHPLSWLVPQVRVTTEIWGKIDGRDTRLPGPPAPAYFPTPVVDPDLYGGAKFLVAGGAKLRWPKGEGWMAKFMKRQTLEFEVGVPVNQYLNGPQQEGDWAIQFGWAVELPRPSH